MIIIKPCKENRIVKEWLKNIDKTISAWSVLVGGYYLMELKKRYGGDIYIAPEKVGFVGQLLFKANIKTLGELEAEKNFVVFEYQKCPGVLFTWNNLICFEGMEKWGLIYKYVRLDEQRKVANLDNTDKIQKAFAEIKNLDVGVSIKWYSVKAYEDLWWNMMRQELGIGREWNPLWSKVLSETDEILEDILQRQEVIEALYGKTKKINDVFSGQIKTGTDLKIFEGRI